MAVEADEFPTWLCKRLKNLNLDEEVLGEYIGGILDSDDSNDEEKFDALKDILEGMMETPDENVCSGIFMKWKECEDGKIKKKKEQESSRQDTLAAVMEKQGLATKVNNKSLQNIDVDIKKHVIAQYGQLEDEDISSDSEEESPTTHANKSKAEQKDKELFQNTNASSVAEKDKEKRDKQKLENEGKKLKIKQDREKQKEKVEQRKDKEKKRTQKGERRR